DFNLVRLECTCWYRYAFNPNHFQLLGLWLLFLDVEIPESDAVPFSQWQSGNDFIRAGTVSEESSTEIGVDWLRLTVHSCGAGCLTSVYIQLDAHWSLLNRPVFE